MSYTKEFINYLYASYGIEQESTDMFYLGCNTCNTKNYLWDETILAIYNSWNSPKLCGCAQKINTGYQPIHGGNHSLKVKEGIKP